MSRTITEQTDRGEISYEVVGCASCGNEVVKSEAKRFVVVDPGGVKSERSWSDYQKWEVYHGDYETGWACPHCAEEPAGYPQIRGVRASTVVMVTIWLGCIIGLVAAGIAGSPVMGAFLTGIGLVTGAHLAGRAITE